MIHYLWWIPLTIAYYVFCSWLSVKNSEGSNYAFLSLVIAHAFGPWVLVSRVSQSIIFDAVLYDIIAIIIGLTFLIYFSGKMLTFSMNQYIGITFAILGMILFKIK